MAADDDLPWTTSRCNRLLRPLSSKLAKLRKELERPRSAHGEARIVSSAFATKGSPNKTTNFTRPAYKPRGFDKARDPDWKPSIKPAAGKKTYGGRNGKKPGAQAQRNTLDARHVARPGEIAFTPLVARMGAQLHSSPMIQQSPLKKYGKQRGPLLVDTSVIQAQGGFHKLIQGLLEAYANILQATTTGDERRWRGTRSLMGACLRRLPAYIELEDYFAKLDKEAEEEEDDNERDVAAEVYEHLETQFEQRRGQGWKPFKQVVRAHATALVCDAIGQDVLGLESLSILVTHCLNVSAWDEAERLILSHIPLVESLPIPVNLKSDLFDPQRSTYLSIVKGFVDRSGRYRLMFDVLEHMIAHELLPLEWLATECMRSIWDRLARSTSENDHRTIVHAAQFFETATIAGMGLPDERLLADESTGGNRSFFPSSRAELRLALDTTYSSLLTVLCSIALVNNNRKDEHGQSIARGVMWMLSSATLSVSGRNDIKIEMGILRADEDDVQTFAQRAILSIFATFIVQLDGYRPIKDLMHLRASELIDCISRLASQYSLTDSSLASILANFTGLIVSITRGTGRIWDDDGFDQLQRLVNVLMTMSGCRLPHKLWTLKRLALESVVEYSHVTGKAQHLAYARDIEKKLHTQGQLVIMPSPSKTDRPSSSGGFRWEEGIGEWVACTPFVKQGAQKIVQKTISSLDLLPTPEPSEEDESNSPKGGLNDSPRWDTTENFDDNEDDDEVPLSSPINKVTRNSSTSLGKRSSVSFPMVVIPAKRTRMTPPDMPITYYPYLPEEKEPSVVSRRTRRSTGEIKAITSRLRTQRSRTSLDSGLRHQLRRTYTEPVQIDEDLIGTTSSDESIVDTSALRHIDSSRVLRVRKCEKDKANNQVERNDDDMNDVNEPDDLIITPNRPNPRKRIKRKLPRRNSETRSWWKIKRGVINDSDDGSEDELSFH